MKNKIHKKYNEDFVMLSMTNFWNNSIAHFCPPFPSVENGRLESSIASGFLRLNFTIFYCANFPEKFPISLQITLQTEKVLSDIFVDNLSNNHSFD